MTKLYRVISVVLIALFITASIGCYGSFNLVTKVYKWNGTIGDKWVNEIAFLALNIVPVYGISVFIDAVILNSLEFWTGKNPVSASIDLPDQKASFAVNESDGTMTFTSEDGSLLTVTLVEGGAEVRNADGVLVARSLKTATGVEVYDGQGNLAGSMTNSQIETLTAR